MKYSQFCRLVNALIKQGTDPDPVLVIKAGTHQPSQPIDYIAVYHTGKKFIIWGKDYTP